SSAAHSRFVEHRHTSGREITHRQKDDLQRLVYVSLLLKYELPCSGIMLRQLLLKNESMETFSGENEFYQCVRTTNAETIFANILLPIRFQTGKLHCQIPFFRFRLDLPVQPHIEQLAKNLLELGTRLQSHG